MVKVEFKSLWKPSRARKAPRANLVQIRRRHIVVAHLYSILLKVYHFKCHSRREMVNHRSRALTLFTPSIEALFPCIFSPKRYTLMCYHTIDRRSCSCQSAPPSRTSLTTKLSYQHTNNHLRSSAKQTTNNHRHTSRIQARSTSAATTDKHSLRPPSPQLPQRTSRSTLQAKERALPSVQRSSPRNHRSSRLLSFVPLKQIIHVYIHSLISTSCIVPPTSLLYLKLPQRSKPSRSRCHQLSSVSPP